MTQAELLLLKLNTGHGPFKRFVGLCEVWPKAGQPHYTAHNATAIVNDPILICLCHGYAFDTEKLVNARGDWRHRVRDI